MTEYQKVVEDFRHHYKIKYNVELDDVTLYFFIRVNEMHTDLKKDISDFKSPQFRSGLDYFLYSLGNNLKWIVLSVTLITMIYLFSKIFIPF